MKFICDVITAYCTKIRKILQTAFLSLQMADDPERDIVPVREGASCEKQRDGLNFSLSGEKGNDRTLISYLYKF